MFDLFRSHSYGSRWQSRSSYDSLQRRRLQAHLRHLLIVLLSGLTVFAVCQSIVQGLQRQIQVVVAARNVARGATLRAEDLGIVKVPDSAMTPHFILSIGAAEGRQSQTELKTGQPLVDGSIKDSPGIASGRTSIQIRLASVPAQIATGDSVRLVSSGTCSSRSTTEDAQHEGNDLNGLDESSSNDESNSVLEPLCVLADEAQVLQIAEKSNETLLNSITSNREEETAVIFCVSPEEAMAILRQQEQAPILAVSD
ncbi:MAG: SAF domain-containing protein [Bifidobacterium sp.]|uniref:SAF domain-containing protein n=1 Tax=Bifidobacterium fermentum TaxID=3059035 RepID=A0AB39UH08_9BIFI